MPATGKITQVIGSTFDAEFPEDQLPAIYNAVKINTQQDGQTINLTGEVQQHLGGDVLLVLGEPMAIDVAETGGQEKEMTTR